MDYDSPWKEAMDRYFPAFMEAFFPSRFAAYDWKHDYESLDTELRKVREDAATGKKFIDKLVKVYLHNGEARYLHIEIQVYYDPLLGYRLHVYNYRIEDIYHHPVQTLLVLGDENPDWCPREYVYEEDGSKRTLGWPLVKLLTLADRLEELESGPLLFMRLVVAHLVAQRHREEPEERRGWKLRLIRGLRNRNLDTEDLRQWVRYIDWLLQLPAELEAELRRTIDAEAKEGFMPYVMTWERNARAEGRTEGVAEGGLNALRAAVEEGLQLKFPAEVGSLLPALQQCKELAKLQLLTRALILGQSLDEIRVILGVG